MGTCVTSCSTNGWYTKYYVQAVCSLKPFSPRVTLPSNQVGCFTICILQDNFCPEAVIYAIMDLWVMGLCKNRHDNRYGDHLTQYGTPVLRNTLHITLAVLWAGGVMATSITIATDIYLPWQLALTRKILTTTNLKKVRGKNKNRGTIFL